MTVLLTNCAKLPKNPEITWEQSITLPAEAAQVNLGVAGPMVGVLNGQLLIAAGANFPNGFPWDGGKKAYQKKAYLYRIAGDHLILNKEFALEKEIAYSANYSDGKFLYAAAGENQQGPTNQVFRFNLDTQNVLHRDTLAPLPLPLTNAGLVVDREHLYLVGGENASLVSDQVYVLNPEEKAWKKFLTLPYPISNAVVVSNKKGKFYIAGGRKRNLNAKSDLYQELFEVDLLNKTINAIAQLPVALAAGTGVYWDEHVILFGGDDARTFHQVEEAIGKINTTSDPQQKDSLIAAKNLLQVNHPGFRQQVIAFDVKTKQWKDLGKMNGLSPVTTTAVLSDEVILIPSGEIRAGVRTDQILIGRVK
ncbi:MAG: Kelch repeat-containing protein [Sphingobacterium sp.]